MSNTSDFPQWNSLRIFYYVAFFKSFSKAARYLKINQSAISRMIKILEEKLGDKLFSRGGGVTNLTDKGEKLFNIVENVFREITVIESIFPQASEEVGEYLKVICASHFISLYLSSRIYNFVKAYLKITPILEEARGEIESYLDRDNMIIHPYIENRPDLVQHYITRLEYKLYACSEYLKRSGKLERIADLDFHSLIEVTGNENSSSDMDWHLRIGRNQENRRNPAFQVNSILSGLKLAEEGLGIISLPSNYPGLKASGLREVLPEISGATVDMYYIFPEALKEAKNAKAFGDYLKKVLND